MRTFQQTAADRRHDYSFSSVTSRYRRDPHSLSATYFSLAATSMSALLPSGKVPTTRVRLQISRLSRSMALLVLILRQCSRGNLVYVSVSAQPSMTTLAASFIPDPSSPEATSIDLASAASRDSMAWMALSMAATFGRLDLGTLASTLR